MGRGQLNTVQYGDSALNAQIATRTRGRSGGLIFRLFSTQLFELDPISAKVSNGGNHCGVAKGQVADSVTHLSFKLSNARSCFIVADPKADQCRNNDSTSSTYHGKRLHYSSPN
jgi:hypothetical protein